jgi:tetrahydromethanopterin S-methyltransferase subunit E
MVQIKVGYSVIIGFVILAIEYLVWQVTQMQVGWPLPLIETQCGPIFCQLGYSQTINPVGVVVDFVVYVIIAYVLVQVLRRF